MPDCLLWTHRKGQRREGTALGLKPVPCPSLSSESQIELVCSGPRQPQGNCHLFSEMA